MKHTITIIALLLITAIASAQNKPTTQPLPHNVLAPQDTLLPYDFAAYQAHDDFSYYLNSAGKDIITSVVLDGIGLASVIIGTQVKNEAAAMGLTIAGAGLAIFGVGFLMAAGVDLKKASDAHRRIHPIPNGVSINLD